jgi:hypothetical protein
MNSFEYIFNYAENKYLKTGSKLENKFDYKELPHGAQVSYILFKNINK